MATVAGCTSCRGKFPLLEQGGVECQVCTAFHRLRNLVWGARFPGELGVTASRALHSCYLQLLQEADQFYFQLPSAGVQLLPNAPKGSEPHTPDKEGRDHKKKEKEKKDRKDKRDREKSPGREKKRKHTEVQEEIAEEAPPAGKEKKAHRREDSRHREETSRRVKEESPNAEREGLASVKEEEAEEWEDAESETETADEASRSKSPLPRRRDLSSPVRPASPPGPPPAREARESSRPPGRWSGPIPAGHRRLAPEPGVPPGLAPKVKAKKKKKNKGRKHKERQERRREERQHRERGRR